MLHRPRTHRLAWATLALLLAACREPPRLASLEAARGLRVPVEFPAAPPPSAADGLERAQRLFAPNSEPIAEPDAVALAPGAASTRSLQLARGACYLVAAWTSANGPGGVRIALTAPDGAEVAATATVGELAVIERYCPDTEGTHVLRMRGGATPGEVASAVWRRIDPVDPLDAALEEVRARYAPNARAEGPLLVAHVAPGGEHSAPLVLTSGRCWTVLAVGEAPLVDLDAELVSPLGEGSGGPVLRDLGVDAAPALVGWCPPETRTARVRFHAREGYGRFAWRVWSEPAR